MQCSTMARTKIDNILVIRSYEYIEKPVSDGLAEKTRARDLRTNTYGISRGKKHALGRVGRLANRAGRTFARNTEKRRTSRDARDPQRQNPVPVYAAVAPPDRSRGGTSTTAAVTTGVPPTTWRPGDAKGFVVRTLGPCPT